MTLFLSSLLTVTCSLISCHQQCVLFSVWSVWFCLGYLHHQCVCAGSNRVQNTRCCFICAYVSQCNISKLQWQINYYVVTLPHASAACCWLRALHALCCWVISSLVLKLAVTLLLLFFVVFARFQWVQHFIRKTWQWCHRFTAHLSSASNVVNRVYARANSAC